MLKVQSSVMVMRHRSVASTLSRCTHVGHNLRCNSFKAFIQRNERATKAESDDAEKPRSLVRKPTNGKGDSSSSFSNIGRRNEASKTSRNNSRGFLNNRDKKHRDDIFFTSQNNTRPSTAANHPWAKQRQNTDNAPRTNRNSWGSNSSFGGGISKPDKPLSEKALEDLKDISALRSTFMPNRPNTAEPWRSKKDDPDSLVGKKFTPSWYTTKKPTTDAGSPVVSKISGNQSLEQILRNNSQARKQDMAQRYRNAGEAVPSDLQEGQKMNYSWRQPGGKNEYAGRNGRNGNFQRNNNQPNNRFQQKNAPMGRAQRQAGVKQRPWYKKPKRKPLPSSAPKEVKLPNTSMTLVDLSLLLRVRKRAIVRTLRDLGEQMSYQTANQDSFKIEPEMMEYICLELGIEPIKSEQKVSSVEEAERRALRQSAQPMDEEERTEEEEKYAALPPRPPVVSIMGHVDHGKTTLMDALRRRSVTASSNKKESKKKKKTKSRGDKGVSVDSDDVAGTEAGGITQVITAFEVPLPLDESSGDDEGGSKQLSTVTFLDTPGHAAFKKMRQSGSSATDVIVLVVAADDGVSPQTIEIIDMYKSIARSQPQSISLVIAVSKIDKHGIDIDEAIMRIENQLIEQEIFTENVLAGGGDGGEFGACQLFPVSGLTGEGLDDLIEGLALQSELMDLRADFDARGEGIVIDARMEKGLGVVADCVIRWGKVERGDFVVSGTNGGKVRFLNDVSNKPLNKARPSQPVRIVGFKSTPKAGDPIVIAASEEEAKEIIRLRESELFNEDRAEVENDVELQVMGTANKQGSMMQKAQEKYGFDNNENDDEIVIPVVIKADSHGALEAVRDALVSIGTDSKLNVVIDPVDMSTGVVTTSDVVIARESNAAIFTFGKVGLADKETKTLAETDEVPIRNHDIIYRLLEDAKEYFERYLPTEDVVVVHGKATVQAVFDVTDSSKKSVAVAGLRVTDGTLFKLKSKTDDRGLSLPCFYKVIRNGEVIMSEDEKLKAISLRKVKENVDSVRRGDECGLGLEGFNDIKEGDVVECFSIEQKRGSL